MPIDLDAVFFQHSIYKLFPLLNDVGMNLGNWL